MKSRQNDLDGTVTQAGVELGEVNHRVRADPQKAHAREDGNGVQIHG